MYKPSPKLIRSLLNSDVRSGLSIPRSGIVAGILSQVESTIELTNRIYDRYLPDRAQQPMSQVRHSAA